MGKDRHRIGYTFWLDLKKPQEEKLSDVIELLKNKRSFASTIRDGLRLIHDLREGRVDVLHELFPWTKIAMQSPAPPSGNDDLKKEIAFLTQLILAQRPDDGLKMIEQGRALPARTPRPSIAPKPGYIEPIVSEVDTSSALLDAFDMF